MPVHVSGYMNVSLVKKYIIIYMLALSSSSLTPTLLRDSYKMLRIGSNIIIIIMLGTVSVYIFMQKITL